jgi:TBC1 domain family member 15
VSDQSGTRSRKQSLYLTYKRQWRDQLKLGPLSDPIHENLFRIEKDVVRTDRGHPFYESSKSQGDTSISETIAMNEKLTKLQNMLMTYTTTFPLGEPGFVQGMADLASVFLITMEHESDAFWCFAQFMNQFKSNFYADGSGIKKQLDSLRLLIQAMDPPLYSKFKSIDGLHLFSAFRWILVLFRREFEMADVQLLWDVLFTHNYTNDFQVFISFAILQRFRTIIIEQMNDHDELLRVELV